MAVFPVNPLYAKKTDYDRAFLEKLPKSMLVDLVLQERKSADINAADRENISISLSLECAKNVQLQHDLELAKAEIKRLTEQIKSLLSKSYGESSEVLIGILSSIVNEVEAHDSSLPSADHSSENEDNQGEEKIIIDEKKTSGSDLMSDNTGKTASSTRSKHKKGKGKTKGAKDRHPRKPSCDEFNVTRKTRTVDPEILKNLNQANLQILPPLHRCRLVYVPGHWEWVYEDIERFSYYPMGEECSFGPVNEDGSVIILPEDTEPELFPRCAATPSAIAHLIYSKYVMGIPVARMAKDFSENGFIISRQKISNWMIRAAEEYFTSLVQRMKEHLQQQEIVHMDETYFTELSIKYETGRNKCYFVQARSSEAMQEKIVLYEYFQSRGKSFVEAMLGDLSERKIAIHCDGYQAYHGFGENVKVVGCHDHARRKIVAGVKVLDGFSKYRKLLGSQDQNKISRAGELRMRDKALNIGLSILDEYMNLYTLEKSLKEKTYEERKKVRQLKSRAILDNIYSLVENGLKDKVLDGAPTLKEGLEYLQNQKKYLYEFLEDGRYEISNCTAEQGMRRAACLRKNSLFIDSERGGHVTAMYMSLTQTCVANHVRPEAYLEYVLNQLMMCQQNPDDLDKLLPFSSDLPEWLKIKE